MYIKPHCHINAYLIGLLLGYLMVVHRKRIENLFHHKFLFIIICLLATMVGLFALTGLYPIAQVRFI